MPSTAAEGPGAVRVRPGRIELNADRSAAERRSFVFEGAG